MSQKPDQRLEEYRNKLIQAANEDGLELISEKTIPYGVQLVFSDNNEQLPLNVYYSEKKGISTVIGGNDNKRIKRSLAEIIHKLNDGFSDGNIHSWQSWLGTDEAGKGDFFGALVVAGFYADQDIVDGLRKMGVKDSKLISRNMLEPIALKLYKSFKERICVVVLHPVTYNKLYLEFKGQNKKLNELMAWMHGRVILNLLEKTGENKVVVDKFTTDKKLIKTLKDLNKIELLQVPKAEKDLAVAAASIIARYHYLESLKQIQKKYRIDFKAGSGEQSLETGVLFVQKYSLDKLQEVAKIHFKNYDKIKEKLTHKKT
ncbi:MAG: ribonuclease HIII [Candidatus Cloacimonetes bacterium]|nr:ribonuclease HIII [Candidatus Cloacimonadota bacterium]